MAVYGTTLTVPTITGSHSGYVGQIKTGDLPAAALNGPNQVDNGGGNIQVYTDDTKATRLAIDIVECVVGGSPSFLAYVRMPTGATGQTIYFVGDDVQTSQPAVTAPYGRNEVWQDYEFVTHDLVTDVTGNYTGSFTITGGPTQITGPFGNSNAAYLFDGSNDRINYDMGGRNPLSGMVENDTLTIQAWLYSTSTDTNNRAVHVFGSGIGSLQVLQNVTSSYNFGMAAATTGVTTQRALYNDSGTETSWTCVHGNMSLVNNVNASGTVFVNGSSTGSTSDFTTNFGTGSATNTICFGERNDGVGDYFGGIAEARFRKAQIDGDWIAAEYDNMNSSTWFSNDGWTAEAGSGINVSAAVVNYDIAALASDVNTPYDVLATVSNYDINALAATVSFSGAIDVTALPANYDITALVTTVAVSGDIDVIPQPANIDYTANNATVSLFGTIDVNVAVTNYNIEAYQAYVQNETISVECICGYEGVITTSINFDGIITGDIGLNGLIDDSDINRVGAIDNSDLAFKGGLCHCE